MLYDPHLDLFLQVAKWGSFSKAAAANFITPSAVIKQINALENSLGVRLFDRSHRGLTLTKAGESLREDIPALIRLSDQIEARATSSMKQDANSIRIGSSPMTPAEVLVELWPRVSELLPGIKFQLIPFENTPENASHLLRNMGEDIDVVAGIFDDALLKYHECAATQLSLEPLCVSFSLNHPLARLGDVTIEDLYGEEVMMITPGRMGCMDALRDFLTHHHSRIKIKDFTFYNTAIFNECENSEKLLVTIERWRSVHPLLKTVNLPWDFEMPYGLLHAPSPEPKVKRFLHALEQIV